ncbi:MAG: hypothetical protein K5683_02445 [Prevotella sp.]|nr:hypothetical protein [Prevotella sp.]
MKILALTRAPQFSPHSEQNDLAILMAVVQLLRADGHEVVVIPETDVPVGGDVTADLCLSMGRLPATLSWLQQMGIHTINRPEGVANCARSVLDRLMREHAIPMPPATGPHGYWLKRGDACAQSSSDVVFCPDKVSLQHAISQFAIRHITDYVVSAHLEGDLVKFYGVLYTSYNNKEDVCGMEQPMGFFRHFYPTDDGVSKFGDEQRNGDAHHYDFDLTALQQTAERLARLVGVAVYGGDCIVAADGTFSLIDFNDWPSFSRCRNEAARAIANMVQNG